MVSLMRVDNELIRARGGQLHTIRTLIKPSEVTHSSAWDKTAAGGRGPCSLPLPLKLPLSFKVRSPMKSPHPSHPAHPRTQSTGTSYGPSSKTDLSLNPGFTLCSLVTRNRSDLLGPYHTRAVRAAQRDAWHPVVPLVYWGHVVHSTTSLY